MLLDVLEELHHERTTQAGPGDTGLGDYGESLVPRLVDRGRAFTHELPGYWRDLGQPHLYLAAHQDLLSGEAEEVFSDPAWPFLTRQPQRQAARLDIGCEVEDSLASPGARVAGVVRRSVLGPGAVVHKGATVSDSVLFADRVVEQGAEVSWSVVDTGCVIGAHAMVGDRRARAVENPSEATSSARTHGFRQGRSCLPERGSNPERQPTEEWLRGFSLRRPQGRP